MKRRRVKIDGKIKATRGLIYSKEFGSSAKAFAKIQKDSGVFIGNPHMIHPDFPGSPPTMFICGNDEQAKKMATESILTPFGWETIDIGIEGARLLEPLAMLWITHYFRTGTIDHALPPLNNARRK